MEAREYLKMAGVTDDRLESEQMKDIIDMMNIYRVHLEVRRNAIEFNGGSLVFSWGKYGGFYWFKKFTLRLCLGWIAFTYIPTDIDNILSKNLDRK